MTTLHCPYCNHKFTVKDRKTKDDTYTTCNKCKETIRVVYACDGTPYLSDGKYPS